MGDTEDNWRELLWGTRVVRLADGEIAMVMRGVDFNQVHGWITYEIETVLGVEIWRREEFDPLHQGTVDR